MNGGTRRSSAAAAAKQQGLAFFSIIVSIARSTGFLGSERTLFNSKCLTVANIYAPNEVLNDLFNSKCLTVANIYAPNEDVFFDHLSNFKCGEIIIGGDFNLVFDVEKDKRGGLARTHKNALKVIRNFSENLGLSDVWRLLNPEARRYTWRQNQPVIHCRLDFFLVSESSLCDVTHADIFPGFQNGSFDDYSESSFTLEPQRQRFLEAKHVPFIRNEICPRN